MNILKRSLAPITEKAWEEIEDVARDVLKTHLSARRIVDVEGPRGLDFASVSLGRLDVAKDEKSGKVGYGVHKVQPLVESRMIFDLDLWELDNIERGAEDIELDNLEDAARKIAMFEEDAIFHGFKEGHIQGIKGSSPYDKLKFKGDSHEFLALISKGITEFVKASVDGPYSLVVGPDMWNFIHKQTKGYPLKKQLEHLLGGQIILNAFLKECYLFSVRGGDMKLYLGQDLSIGYHAHDTEKVKLYLSESFTFRIIDPAVIMEIDWEK
ncbi:MAG: bacteriocin [candidate division Zixibacteria bacterium]|nr:bacteriocin [candidate division Zixibacteria bacterium]